MISKENVSATKQTFLYFFLLLKAFTIGGNYPLMDRSFNTSVALGNLLDDTLPNNHDYDHHNHPQQRSMLMMNSIPNLPQWSMPQLNFTSTPIVK